jgi:hypothetical protein
LLAATISAGVVSGNRNQQNSEKFVLFFNADELVVELLIIFEFLVDDSREIADYLVIDVLVGGVWIDEEQMIRCNIFAV